MQLFKKISLLFCFIFSFNITSYSDICPDLYINGEEIICINNFGTYDNISNRLTNGVIYDYEVNYDKYSWVSWEVENGDIVYIDGTDVHSLMNDFALNQSAISNPNDFLNKSYKIKFGWKNDSEKAFSFNLEFYENGQITSSHNLLGFLSQIFTNKSRAKKISIRWDGRYSNHSVTSHMTAGFLGVCGSHVYTKFINTSYPFDVSITTSTNKNLFCNQVATINANYISNNVNYSWSTAGASVSNNWGNGIYIERFTTVGNVPITLTGSNACGTKSSTINFTITPPNYGEVQQNGVNVSGANANYVVPNCQGNFWLGIPTWVSNYCTYTWELPLGYSPDANVYTINRVSGLNLLNVSGKLPDNALTDFVGKVTITGLCGDPVVKTFVIKPTLKPTIDPDFYSCANTVNIKVNNPNGSSNINPWVASSTNGTWGYFSNNTSTNSLFTASGPGNYVVKVGLTDASNCYVELNTNIHIGTGNVSGMNNNAVNGWQAGVLSDNRMRVGSNLVAYGNAIYFEGRDGKLYYYNFDNALQKWVINQVPGLTNVTIPTTGTFNKINFVALNNTPYICFADNTGRFMKLNLLTNGVDDALGYAVNLKNNNSFIAQNGEIFGIDNQGLLNTVGGSTSLFNSIADFKISVPNKGLIYLLNNNLFSTVLGQLTFTNDVTSGSDVVYYNGYLYYTRGSSGSANLYRMDMNAINNVETITTTSNLSCKFSINPASGVIYYGVLVGTNTPFVTNTLSSGTYRTANIYQAHQENGIWLFNRATAVTPIEGADMLIHSPIYVGNHLIYIGAGHNNVIGGAFELEVWNLFYESSCAPNLQRTATISNTETAIETVETLIDVYPNPFVNELTILSNSSDSNNVIEVKVYDATGKLVYNQTLNSTQSINTDKWVSGVYIVKIIQGNQVINKTLIKVN